MTEQEAIEEIRSCLGVNNIIMPYSDEMDAFGMAIESLEKQIPKKPLMIYYEVYDDEMLSCPNCKDILTDRIPMNNKDFYFYCFNCGQKLDWSD